MAEIIDLPQQGSGTERQQLEEMYRYLYRLAKDLNLNFQQIGYNGLTDEEQALMKDLTRAEMSDQQKAEDSLYAGTHNYAEAQTLKSLIIKTAQFVRDEVENIRTVLYGEESASGQFGEWKRKKGLRVDVTPDGVKQTYSYAEIVKGMKTFEINSKNYIKTGYLRTENSLPVYGVAIGKDVVTFSEDGTETYNDSNKVAELTADALSFYHNGVILAKYAGTKTSFYANGAEVMYIQSGKIYSSVDMELGSDKKVKIGSWTFDRSGLMLDLGGGSNFLLGQKVTGVNYYNTNAWLTVGPGGISVGTIQSEYLLGEKIVSSGSLHNAHLEAVFLPIKSAWLGDDTYKWFRANIETVYCTSVYYSGGLYQDSSRDVKHDIQDMPEAGETLDRLNPVTFIYDNDPDERRKAGLIYEDTMLVLPEICTQNEGGKAIDYLKLVPYLLKEIQSLRARVSELERRN